MKKVLPIVMLIILIIWGIYNVIYKKNSNTNAHPQTINIVDAAEGIKTGNLASDFGLTTLDGKQVKLSDYRGKKVILNFWATWCPPCKAEIPDMEKFYSDFKSKDVIILGVNLTQSEKSEQSVSTFAKTYGITYPVLLDKDGMAAQIYQISAIPASYIIDTKGIIRNKIVGPMDYERMENMLSSIN